MKVYRSSILVVLLLAQNLYGQPSAGPAPVVVAPVVQRPIRTGEMLVGTVRPSKKAVLGTAVDGRVIELLANEGDRVRKDEPLVRLLTATIELELAAAQAELELRRAQLLELKNGSRPEELDQVEAAMAGAKARMEFLEARRTRTESLRSRSVASKDDFDEAISAAIEAEQTFLEAQSAHKLAVAGPRVERIAQAEAQVKSQAAIVDRLKTQIRLHTIVSRFDGYITAKHTEIGQWANRGEPTLEVVALDPVEVQLYVPEEQIPFVRLGAQVSVEVPALGTKSFDGTVAIIIQEADQRSRTFPVKIRIPNPVGDDGPELKSGMTARISLPTGDSQMAMLVPKDAVVLGGASPIVFVVDATAQPATVRPVPVQLGDASGQEVSVVGQLEPGQFVVVQGNERLRPDQPVKIITLPGSGQTSPATAQNATR